MKADAKLFMDGYPWGWEPKVGEKVAVYVGLSPDEIITDRGTVLERFETPHYSGRPIVGYRIDCGGGHVVPRGINSLRPLSPYRKDAP